MLWVVAACGGGHLITTHLEDHDENCGQRARLSPQTKKLTLKRCHFPEIDMIFFQTAGCWGEYLFASSKCTPCRGFRTGKRATSPQIVMHGTSMSKEPILEIHFKFYGVDRFQIDEHQLNCFLIRKLMPQMIWFKHLLLVLQIWISRERHTTRVLLGKPRIIGPWSTDLACDQTISAIFKKSFQLRSAIGFWQPHNLVPFDPRIKKTNSCVDGGFLGMARMNRMLEATTMSPA